MRYACNRHKSKGKKWIIKKYFHTFEGRKWIFATPDRASRLKLYSKRVGQNRYVKVTKGKSPYDGDTRYWNNRWKSSASPTQRTLHDQQNGKCAWCKGNIYTGQVVEIDHIVPKKDGGSNTIKNLRLVHGHCHDQVHKLVRDMEEPYELKGSRTVLKGSLLR
jgi:5-methylcytosine-specific restriction endonuclease McrA